MKPLPVTKTPAQETEETLPRAAVSSPAPHDLWAITAYFNPSRYKRRLANYRLFRRHLGVPLVTVELAFGDAFELTDEDAEILIQLQGRDVMWQKERLLNLAILALPPACRKVMWVDCDVIFEESDWASRASRKLDEVPLLQPFSHTVRTPQGWLPTGEVAPGTDVWLAAAHMIESGEPVETCLRGSGEELRCAHGMAWAARRDLVERHGFFDAAIVGGGDSALFRAAFGYFRESAERLKLNPVRDCHYRAWAEPFFASVRGRVGYVPGTVFHLWHGSLQTRKYVERHDDFAAFAFDPYVDVAVADNGVWRWNSEKPEMHAFLRAYFNSRREDD